MIVLKTVLVAAAVIPALYLMVQIYKQDKLEREPKRLIILLAFMGVIATIPAALCEIAGSRILDSLFSRNSTLYRILMNYLIVACSEEGFKYLLLKKASWKTPCFNCRFDGVVYAVTVSLGFALWENIGYVTMFGFGNAILRALTAVPGHASFGVFMGVYYGLAKHWDNYGNPRQSAAFRKKAFWLPALLHGSYDFIAGSDSLIMLVLFVAFVVGMFAVARRLVKKTAREDYFITARRDYFEM